MADKQAKFGPNSGYPANPQLQSEFEKYIYSQFQRSKAPSSQDGRSSHGASNNAVESGVSTPSAMFQFNAARTSPPYQDSTAIDTTEAHSPDSHSDARGSDHFKRPLPKQSDRNVFDTIDPDAKQPSLDQNRSTGSNGLSEESRDLLPVSGSDASSPVSNQRKEIEQSVRQVTGSPPDVKSSFGFLMSPTLSPQPPDNSDCQEQDTEMSDPGIKKEG